MKLTKRYRYFEPAKTEPPDPLHDYENSVTYHYNDVASEYDSSSEVVAKIVDENKFDIPALPESGTIEAKKLYQWNGIVVRCRRKHERTNFDPTDTLALFTVFRKDMADDVTIIGGDAAWQLGAAVEVIPINTIHANYALHFVNVSVATATDNYELVLYSDAACTTEIARNKISKGTVQSSASSVPLRTEVLTAEGGVWVKVASSTGGEDSIEISLSYHTH
jgi:hypothetical protein